MNLRKALLAEFDHEMATTRKVLERIPGDKLEWTPHRKSWSMGNLAAHIANLPVWAVHTVRESSFDLEGPEARERAAPVGSSAEALGIFDKNVAAARSAVEGSDDTILLEPWTLQSGERTVFTMPKIAVIRSFVISHIIHHRAQLGVYLRLNDIPVPPVYGPTADEGSL